MGMQRPSLFHGSADLRLVLHSLRRSLDLLRIAQVAAELQRRHGQRGLDGLQVLVEVVHQGRARRDLQAGDDIVRDVLDVLHDGADGVAMRRHEHRLPRCELGLDLLLPIRHHALDHRLQRFRLRDILGIHAGVLRLLLRVELAVLVDVRRRQVEATAPDLHLLRAVLHHRLLLVQAGQAAVHALVQPPRLVHRGVQLIRGLQGQVASLDGPLQVGGVADVELQPLLLDQLAGPLGLTDALLGEVDVHPTRELVRHVPLRLAVAGENELCMAGHGAANTLLDGACGAPGTNTS
mmetsp:Transcript_104929/g.292034  ORF Transcript_104929/g.292034 Transcript_104929/m.292034 type:complete len:293 (+) Transcript_104929:179-1057(+)